MFIPVPWAGVKPRRASCVAPANLVHLSLCRGTQMSKLNFALVGCGRIAPKHVDALTSGAVSGAQLVAVCDERFERAQAVAQKHASVKAFASGFDMMDKMAEQID